MTAKPTTARTRNRRVSTINLNLHKIIVFLSTEAFEQEDLELLLIQSNAMVQAAAIARGKKSGKAPAGRSA